MQFTQSSGEPRILRCPQCGAPLNPEPLALTTQCAYCGHSVKLPEPPPPMPVPPVSAGKGAPTLLVVGGVVAFVGVVLAISYSAGMRRISESSAKPISEAAVATARASSDPPAPAPAVAEPVEKRYAMRSLLGVSAALDIDASGAHMKELFPTVSSERRANELQYTVPLEHRWFSEAELNWKNEREGKLTSVAFRPPAGAEKFENQKEIADCLAKGLGKPEERELDHLAGEMSYFWGKHFPKAWANLYSSYLWLTFQKPQGIAPITLADVVRALDGCAPEAP